MDHYQDPDRVRASGQRHRKPRRSRRGRLELRAVRSNKGEAEEPKAEVILSELPASRCGLLYTLVVAQRAIKLSQREAPLAIFLHLRPICAG